MDAVLCLIGRAPRFFFEFLRSQRGESAKRGVKRIDEDGLLRFLILLADCCGKTRLSSVTTITFPDLEKSDSINLTMHRSSNRSHYLVKGHGNCRC